MPVYVQCGYVSSICLHSLRLGNDLLSILYEYIGGVVCNVLDNNLRRVGPIRFLNLKYFSVFIISLSRSRSVLLLLICQSKHKPRLKNVHPVTGILIGVEIVTLPFVTNYKFHKFFFHISNADYSRIIVYTNFLTPINHFSDIYTFSHSMMTISAVVYVCMCVVRII